MGETAKQTNKSGMRSKSSRKDDRPIDFSKCGVVIFFVEGGLLNCTDCNPVPGGTGNHLHEAHVKCGLTSADSGLQLDLEGSRQPVSQRRSSPCGLFSRAEDKLKRRMT